MQVFLSFSISSGFSPSLWLAELVCDSSVDPWQGPEIQPAGAAGGCLHAEELFKKLNVSFDFNR